MSPTVFLEHSGHALTNLGDVAMLQAAASRLSHRLPGAELRVPTSAPDRLSRFCPQVVPLPTRGVRALAAAGCFPGRDRFPRAISSRIERLELRLRGRGPKWLDALAVRYALRSGAHGRATEEVLGALGRSVLFVAGGGGYLTDAFPEKARSSLTLLHHAQRRGIPTALLSQGIGPLEDPALRAFAARVLGAVDLIALRERRAGPSLLERLGVDSARVLVTGDDAVAAAYASRKASLGGALGFNLRSAAYAGLSADAMAAAGVAVRRLSQELRAPLVPVPIALSSGGSDADAIRRSIGASGAEEPDPADPTDAMARVARCRLVVTASYHGAVFALAQGIPAVGLSRTPYYAGKFEGLADIFGLGARVVRLNEPGWEVSLEAAVRDLWPSAADQRPALLASAAVQIREQEDAYARVATLAGGSRVAAAEASA